jgi:hypothetical protein
MTTLLTPPEVLMVAVALAVIALAIWERRQSRRIRQLQTALVEQTKHNARLDQDLTALLECSHRIGERLAGAERTQRAMQKQLDTAPADSENEVAVKHALKLLENGWKLTEITEICDLTHGELEILQNLTRHQKTDAA